MKLVWENSGDYIECDPIRDDVIEYYVSELNNNNENLFDLSESQINENNLTSLAQTIIDVNIMLKKMKFEPFDTTGSPLDQNYINKIHHDWVVLNRTSNIVSLLYSIKDLSLYKTFEDINNYAHWSESMWEASYKNYDLRLTWYDNIFDNSVLSFDECNIQMEFNNLGRASNDKWQWFDDNIHDELDNVEFRQMSGAIRINLSMPVEQYAPKNYTKWCELHNTIPIGKNLNLANIKNLKNNLTKCREVMLRNTKENNKLFIEI